MTTQRQFDETDRGVLFRNDRKSHDNQPDYKGQVNIGGVEFWLSAWIKEGKKGKFMSLSVSAKEEARPAAKPAARPKDERYRAGQPATSFDDPEDVPF